MTDKVTNPMDARKQAASKPGMMGDGTEEQNLDQPGNPAARIKKDEVAVAFVNQPPVGGARDVAQPLPKDTAMGNEQAKITFWTLRTAEEVEGTSVYNLQGEKLGTVDDIILDKVSGNAIYVLVSCVGFLGIEEYYPLPWSALKYDESTGGYLVNLDKKMLEHAPTCSRNEDFRWTPDYGRQVDKYYNAPTHW